ncbi:MAG: CPBP family intramembrane metalloprotease [Bacteroidetes bacterium]|nr:CPBP family intramembrane metalloprotease [Bacteroidota bacterium]
MEDKQNLRLFSQGAFYNLWGLAFVLIFIFLFQIVFSYLSLAISALVYGQSLAEVRQLINAPDGSALSINIYRLSNFIAFTGSMLLPALLFAFINKIPASQIAGWNKPVRLSQILQALAMVVLSIVCVNWLTDWFRHIHWPQTLHYLAEKLDSGRQDTMGTLLDMQTPGELMLCLFLAGLLPAFTEELLFRGILQRIFFRITGKAGTSIFLQATVFALLHLSFYELPAIFLMGIMFGIVTYATGTTWYSVIMHFLFNATSIVLHYFSLRHFEKTGITGAYDDFILPGFYAAFCAIPLFWLLLNWLRIRAKNNTSHE